MIEIRRLHAAGATQAGLAYQFQVSERHVHDLVHYKKRSAI